MYDTSIDLLQKGGSTVSTLLAVQCGNSRMLTVDLDFEMSMDTVRLSMENGRPIEVPVYGLDGGPYVKVQDLHVRKDGWGVEHVHGVVVQDSVVIPVTLHDNPVEADPLNLR